MKKFSILLSGVALVLSSSSLDLAAKTPVLIRGVPDAVQTAITRERGDWRVQSVLRTTFKGSPAYQVRLVGFGIPRTIFIAENGTVVGRVRPSQQAGSGRGTKPVSPPPVVPPELPIGPQQTSRKVTFDELPPPVQKAVLDQADGARIEDIDRYQKPGLVTYEAAFKREGRHQEVTFAGDGTVLETIPAMPTVEPTPTPTPRPTEATFVGTSFITRAELPPPARAALNANAGTGRVESLVSGTIGSERIFQAIYVKQGQRFSLRFREDGSVYRRVNLRRALP